MTSRLAELLADRSWVTSLRDQYSDHPDDHLSSDESMRESVMQTALRLVHVALDTCLASLDPPPSEPSDADTNMATVPLMLGQEAAALNKRITLIDRISNLRTYYFVFRDGVTHVARESAADPNLDKFMAAALGTWGSFFSQVYIDLEDPS